MAVIDPSGVLIGHFAVFFCVAMYASPLAALPTVLETKSAKSIPFAYTMAALVNCTLWTIVGILDLHDVHIYVPTLLGLILSGVQFGLKIMFGNAPDTALVNSSGVFDNLAVFAV